MAVAVDDIVFGRKLTEEGQSKFIDDWCREQLHKLPTTLKQVVNLEGFNSMENKIVIPFTASLSKYLLLSFGINKYKEMYIRLKETMMLADNIKIIEKVYGQEGEDILNRWQNSLSQPRS